MDFQQILTLINRAIFIAVLAAFISTFYFPMPEGMSEQQLGWIQGIVGTLVVFLISSGEKQNDYYFRPKDDELL